MSRSSWPLRIPSAHIHRKSTDFRSFASLAGVYGSATAPRPWACAVSGAPIASVIASAALSPPIRRNFMMVLPVRTVFGVEHGPQRGPPSRPRLSRRSVERHADLHLRAAVGRRADGQLAVEQVEALPHAEETEAVASQAGVHVEADAGIYHLKRDAAFLDRERHLETPY